MVSNVGRIKTKKIKRMTHKIFSENQDVITKDFDKNKEIVNKKYKVNSKKLRNIISGYCARLKKNEV